jgi:hypothetical protein
MSITSILTGTTAGFSVLEGIFGFNAASAQADSLRSQAQLVQAESEADIVRYAENAKEFKTKQAMAYMKSGVALEGSPLDILDETVRVTGENISAMRASTAAKMREIRSKASALEGQGRAALVGGFSKAASVYVSQYAKLGGASAKDTKAQADNFGNGTGFDNGSFK